MRTLDYRLNVASPEPHPLANSMVARSKALGQPLTGSGADRARGALERIPDEDA